MIYFSGRMFFYQILHPYPLRVGPGENYPSYSSREHFRQPLIAQTAHRLLKRRLHIQMALIH